MTPTEQDKNPSNSTPTEQDKELRAELAKLEVYTTVKSEKHPLYHKDIDKIMQLITADRKRVALEAQLIAYESVKSGYSFIEWQRLLELRLKDGTKTPLWFVDRKITELKAQQEKV